MIFWKKPPNPRWGTNSGGNDFFKINLVHEIIDHIFGDFTKNKERFEVNEQRCPVTNNQ